MKQIEVDNDVFAAIWIHRVAPEGTENEILRRILLGRNEIKTSEPSSLSPDHRPNQLMPVRQENMNTMKVRWIDDVVEAFHRLGGEADLAAIYKVVDGMREARKERPVRTLEAIVRRVIEEHSSDSENFGRNASAPDYFSKIGRGRWQLRQN